VAAQIDRVVLAELQRRNRTITWVAERTGIDRGSLSRWLGGERSISVRKAEQVMALLKIAVVPTEALHDPDRRPPRPFRPARQGTSS